jgi:hypothetical protein
MLKPGLGIKNMPKNKPEPVFTDISDTLAERGAWTLLLRVRSHISADFGWTFDERFYSRTALWILLDALRPTAGRKWFTRKNCLPIATSGR